MTEKIPRSQQRLV